MMLKNKYFILFLLLLLIGASLRVILLSGINIGDDEAHYWQYSQNIDLSFYDHPPMTAYLIKITTAVFGDTDFGVHSGAMVCFLISSILLFFLTNRLFDVKTAFYTVLLFNITPVYFIGSLLTIPDAPLSIFWILYIYLMYILIKTDSAKLINMTWIVSGIAMGLILLSKYTGILLFCTAILYVLLIPKLRKYIIKPQIYIAFFISMIIFSPVLTWNYNYDFVSFGYQFFHGVGNYNPAGTVLKINWNIFLQNIIAQIGFISPVLFGFMVYIVIKYALTYRKLGPDRKQAVLFLLVFSVPQLVFFGIIGLFKEILPHWPALSYIPLLILSVSDITYNARFKKMKLNLIFITAILISMIIVLHTLYKIIPFPKNLPEQADITNEIYGWKEVGAQIQQVISKNPDYFLLTHKHYLASQLRFYIPSHPQLFCINKYVDQYDFWQVNGKSALFITDNRFKVNPKELFPFDKYVELPVINIIRNKKIVRQFYVVRCINFRLNRLSPEMIQKINNRKVKDFINGINSKVFFKINKLSGKSKILDYVMILFSLLGDGWFTIPAVFFILLLVNKKQIKPALNDFLIFIIIISIGGIIIYLLKNVFNLPRPVRFFTPLLETGQVDIRLLLSQLDGPGFPSGHTYAGFCSATYLYYVIKNKYGLVKSWVWISLVVCATLIAIGRIYVGAHFLTDVIGGTIVGFLYTYACLYFIKIKQAKLIY